MGFGTRVLGAGKGHLAHGSQNWETGSNLGHHLCATAPQLRPGEGQIEGGLGQRSGTPAPARLQRVGTSGQLPSSGAVTCAAHRTGQALRAITTRQSLG